MEQDKMTRVLDAIQDWGWHVGISIFLILVATMSISQAIEDFNYWRYLDAGWWFIVFYLVSCVIMYLVTDKIKSFWNSRKRPRNVEQMSDNMENVKNSTEQIIGTRDLFLNTLTKIGCQYEVGEGEDEDKVFFAYQGENFTASVGNEGWYVHIWDTCWGHVELYDVDEFARLKKAINISNLNCATMTVYTVDEAGSNVDVHCKAVIPFIPQIPEIDKYLRGELNDFFRAHQYVGNEMAKQREAEKVQ